MGTEMVFCVWPAAKVRVPDVVVKSLPAVAETEAVEYCTVSPAGVKLVRLTTTLSEPSSSVAVLAALAKAITPCGGGGGTSSL
jgi:hypothetical protein